VIFPLSVDRFYVSRKGGTGGGRWVHLKAANSMATSGIGFKKALVGMVSAISLLLCTIGLRKQSSCLVGLPFLILKVLRNLDRWLLRSH